ncbi:hypothetical protein [Inhella proteolytica]|uniref:Uncharacterized protein n=1 Tax=Inhella proteolytica TaxID=2795029 RepID=A0A931J6F5_9BURK|nr:hypothetical protein [Inhella proteolytica]MBH9579623.1 hypothetical protein [Inhella proteolytica]
MQEPHPIATAPASPAEPLDLARLESASLEELMELFSAAIAAENETARAIERFHRGGVDPAELPALREQLQRAGRWTQAVDAAIARQYRPHPP